MRIKFKSLLSAALALLFIACAAVTFARPSAQQISPATLPFQFIQTDPLIVSWKDLIEKATAVEVLNNTAKVQFLAAQLSGFAFTDSQGKLLNNSEVIKLEPDSPDQGQTGGLLRLPPGGSLKIKISVADPKLELKPMKGSNAYSGFISIYEEQSNTAIHKPFKITFKSDKSSGDEENVALKPLVSEETITNYRIIPLVPWWFCYECSVPLQPGIKDGDSSLPVGSVLGGVQREQGDTATILPGQIESSPHSIPKMKLNINDMDHAGKYKGKLNFGTSEKPVDLALTVNAKDIILWPALVLILGIYIALQAKRYLSVYRTLLSLRAQEAGLGEKYDAGNAKFRDTAQGQSYASYDIKDDLASRRSQIIEKLTVLDKKSFVTLDSNDTDYKFILEQLKDLEAKIDMWPDLANKLKGLAESLKNAYQAARALPISSMVPINNQQPAILDYYSKSLVGKKIKVDELPDLSNKVVKATDSISLWTDLAGRVEKDWIWLNRLKGQADKDKLLAAEVQLTVVTSELLLAKNAEDLLDRMTKSDILEIESTLAELSGPPASEAMEASLAAPNTIDSMKSLRAMTSNLAANDFEGITDESIATLSDAEKRKLYEKKLSDHDFVMAVFAFIIAVLTGLNSSYFNKPFGTLQDYLTIFLMGLTTKAALDLINSAIERIFPRA